jgi:succinate dehydrogenase/fumarate reductase flavoprotein subunit
VLSWTEYGKPDLARFGAIAALGSVGKLTKDRDRERVTDRLRDLLQDKNWRARISAIVATRTLEDDGLIPTLSRTVELNEDGREVRLSREAITAIRAQSGQDAEVKKLREDLDRVLTENRELKDRLESLEQRLKS